ncbi:hypothetical protein IWW50_002983 [Coemansia erecta]|nr:hypothetical protein IWW50_002983 [Coemansia erecta]
MAARVLAPVTAGRVLVLALAERGQEQEQELAPAERAAQAARVLALVPVGQAELAAQGPAEGTVERGQEPAEQLDRKTARHLSQRSAHFQH